MMIEEFIYKKVPITRKHLKNIKNHSKPGRIVHSLLGFAKSNKKILQNFNLETKCVIDLYV